ncbi:hypothetical protein ACQCVE_00180 [Metabacillus sp. 113a]|uniref:YqgU-like beta propeller domain-containing protein n=1 Tax=Metabacillus sp. 113a TaxID=3404706 RepID=UPI003CF0E741
MSIKQGRLLAAVLALAMIAAGCANEPEKKAPAVDANVQTTDKQTVIPYEADEQTFQTVGGWLDDKTVVLAEYDKKETTLSTYDFSEGSKKELYRADMAVTHVEVNGTYILMQGSSSANTTNLLLIDSKGTKRFEKEFSSHDLSFSWSEANPDRLFVTAFNEDWTYETAIYYPLTGFEDADPIDAPFAEWSGNGNLFFAKDGGGKGSPLYQYDVQKQEEKKMADEVLSVFSRNHTWITLSYENDSPVFIVQDGIKKQRFPSSLKESEGSLDLPKIEISPSEHEFITYEYNEESDRLNLVSFSLLDQKKTVHIKDALNMPLMYSPDGTRVLYGFQLEKVINLLTGSLKTLVTF